LDNAKRTALEERRRFMRQRNAARAFRASIEPAWTALEAAGEVFRVYRLGEEPSWCPAWIPRGYGRVPWERLDRVRRTGEGLSDVELADKARGLLAERLGPTERLLIVPEGTNWSIELTRAAFDRHAEALAATAVSHAYLAAPPAPWLIQFDGSELVWKDD
jgi:hypothetical protein